MKKGNMMQWARGLVRGQQRHQRQHSSHGQRCRHGTQGIACMRPLGGKVFACASTIGSFSGLWPPAPAAVRFKAVEKKSLKGRGVGERAVIHNKRLVQVPRGSSEKWSGEVTPRKHRRPSVRTLATHTVPSRPKTTQPRVIKMSTSGLGVRGLPYG